MTGRIVGVAVAAVLAGCSATPGGGGEATHRSSTEAGSESAGTNEATGVDAALGDIGLIPVREGRALTVVNDVVTPDRAEAQREAIDRLIRDLSRAGFREASSEDLARFELGGPVDTPARQIRYLVGAFRKSSEFVIRLDHQLDIKGNGKTVLSVFWNSPFEHAERDRGLINDFSSDLQIWWARNGVSSQGG